MTREARFSLPMVLDAIRFERGILLGHSDGASIAEAKRAYETGDLRAKLAKYHAHVDSAFLGWNGAWLAPGFQAWNIEHFIDRWRVPALLIQGADDQYGTLKQIRAIEARSPAPVANLILDACRHSPQIDQPQATLDAVVRFCAEVGKAAAP
jgi:pimeloyl-ACP methyl ester carboxylesterase